MKLHLSHAEAQGAIRRLLNLPVEVDVVIGRKGKGIIARENDFSAISHGLAKLITFIDANHAINKIDAIKELRAQASIINGGSYYGLKEAKDLVENWSAARPHFFKLGRVPYLSYDAHEPQGIVFR